MNSKRTNQKANGLRNRGRSARKSASKNTSIIIPQIRTNVVKFHRFRFVAASAVTNVSITPNSLQGALGGICTVTNTTLAFINRSMKLKRVEVWAPTSTSTTSATCSVEWVSSNGNSTSLEVSDTSINISRPAHLITRPPIDSFANFWQLNSGTALFVLNCPGGSVVDVNVEYIEFDQASAAITAAIATGVLSELYYLALDGPTTNLLRPVSLNTTS